MRRCYVHIGAPKTGTSFLQRMCSDNRDTLRENGVLYPDVSLRGHGHHDLAFLLAGGYPDWAIPQERSLVELETALARAANRHDGHLLLSSENFYLFPQPERLRRVLHDCAFDYRPTIVLYLRRQDEAQESWYNQRVKAQGYTGTCEQSVAESAELWDYAARLERWISVFGREQIVVRVFDGTGRDDELARDFLAVLGLEGTHLEFPAGPVNGGLNRSLLEFQRQLNRLPLAPPERRRFHDELIELSRRSRDRDLFDTGPLLGRDRRREILEPYAESNARIARDFRGGRPLFSPVEGDDAAAGPTDLTVEHLACVMGWLMARPATHPRNECPEPEPEPCLSSPR